MLRPIGCPHPVSLRRRLAPAPAADYSAGTMARVLERGATLRLERWLSEETDVRSDVAIAEQIGEFIERHGAKSVALADRIIGCPYEEGIDYPDGTACPQCPFWVNRDRWSGELLR
jgi:hypothetical protein